MSVFNIGLFNGPRYSAFPWSHDNKISMSAGKLTPIAWEFLNTGDKIEFDVADVVRLAPMVAPTLDTYRVDIHAFAMRLRSLGNANRNPWVYEDFFNLNKNTDGSKSLPSIPLCCLLAINGFRNGTLIESLGFPTFKKDRDEYLNFLRNKCPWVFDPIIVHEAITLEDVDLQALLTFVPSSIPREVETSEGVTSSYIDFDSLPHSYDNGQSYFSYPLFRFRSGSFVYSDQLTLPFKGTLVSYLIQKYPEIIGAVGSVSYNNLGGSSFVAGSSYYFGQYEGINLLDKVFELYKKDAISVMKEFEDWLLDGLLEMSEASDISDDGSSLYYITGYRADSFFARLNLSLTTMFPDLPLFSTALDGPISRFIPSYPFDSYIKIYSDWYINTAIQDPDSVFASYSFDALWRQFSDGESFASDDKEEFYSKLREVNQMFKRFWANDYFTSAFPSPQAGQAVGIPVNGTIVDLRNANAMQKLKERLLYAGKRFRDVMFAITGHKTSAAILEMSEVLGSWSNVINVDSVLQQSETSNSSPQAGYAGTGLGYRTGGKDVKYRADEPTLIMVIASIVPQASYFQGLSKKFCRSNVYDYAIPQLANIGEQVVRTGELYLGSDAINPNGDSDVSSTIFGYTRRNGDWMWTPNEVHGDFRGSLDFWHNARVFGSMPSLSVNFLQVNAEDDNLNRIFAVQSDSYDHFYCNFSFTGHVIRSLPKHVHYEL